MFKKTLFVFALLLTSVVAGFSLSGKNSSLSRQAELHCSSALRGTLEKIEKLPQVRELIGEVLEEGPLYLKVNHERSAQFEGYWSTEDRTISITQKGNTTQAGMITTLLFELHNAHRDKDFRQLDHQAELGEINKRDYVKGIEYIEYENVLAVSTLLDEGIEKGYFPEASAWHPHKRFEDHFRFQKKMGHSGWIAKNYDMLMAT